MSGFLRGLFGLNGRVALVTGGAVNIGRGICLALAGAGAGVIAAYNRSQSEAAELVDEIERSGGRAIALRTDVSDAAQVDALFRAAIEHFGGIDILVNNAGVFTVSPQVDLDPADWDGVFATNLRGVFLCSRAAARVMSNRKSGGCIVNIASINGLHPGFGETAHYDASKGAVIAYTRSLALELAPQGIRVNAVCPGLIDSRGLRSNAPDLAGTVQNRTPLKRLGTPADIGAAVLFLSSSAAGWITGEILAVDGGYLLT
ncbi:MAG: SDR family oxidoreductase [Desulfobacteraceae bacterium]|nr:SDR family oxidoreductase [Desulfobacteraceae bacterium]